LTTEESPPGGSSSGGLLASSRTPPEEEENHREEHGSPGAPCEAESVAANASIDIVVSELVTGFDEDSAGKVVSISCLDVVILREVTYVINEAARLNQNKANKVTTPENPAARRLHGARMDMKKPHTLKRRAKR
jgi:hypothetical protein